MNTPLLIASFCLVLLQFRISSRWAFVPLLIAACHTPYTPFLAGMTVTRAVIFAGLIRATSEGSFKWSLQNSRDNLILCFAVVAIGSTFAHSWEPINPLTTRLRLVMDVVGTYLYARAFLTDNDSVARMAKALALILVPFAVMMALEKQTGRNLYSFIGATNLFSPIRDGEMRAQASFGTPILAGTAGASAFPLIICLWKSHKKIAIIGIIACLWIVQSSVSSGPIGTMFLALGALILWRYRDNMKTIRIAVIVMLVIIHFVRTKPVWHLMTLIDFVGGSTGWHRAYLIDMAIEHFSEWGLLGSDFTQHWMPYALAAVPNHCDLTNYYIHLGVIGGVPLMLCLILSQWKAFQALRETFNVIGGSGSDQEFRLWCVGSALFAHSVTFLSISYFDQMSVFFWMLIGGIPGFISNAVQTAKDDDEEMRDEPEAPAIVGNWDIRQAKGNLQENLKSSF